MLVVATEDELSEAVAIKLVFEAHGHQPELRFMRRNGNVFLKASIDKFCQIASRNTVLVMTDLDRGLCAPHLIADWFGDRLRPAGLIFRVVVREIESWLIADREGLASFLGVSCAKIDRNPDAIPDPKRHLLKIAGFAKGAVRRDILPGKGVRASQGFGYNARLCEFVEKHWSSNNAAQASASLAKARLRIQGMRVSSGQRIETSGSGP